MVWQLGEKYRIRCSTENMDDGSTWTPKDRRSKLRRIDFIRKYMKGKCVKIEVAQLPENVDIVNSMRRPEKAEEDEEMLSHKHI